MPREVEPRGESPCLIARLMGLDTLPCKQEKILSEVNKHQTSNVERTPNRYTLSRKSSKDEQQFRDVYEVLEAKRCGMGSDLHQGTADCYLTVDKASLMQKKLMDAKCLSTDENFQDAKEFYDVLEVLESNEVFPRKFLQQPDSLFRRHLNDVQVAPCHSKCRRRSCAVLSNASGGHNGICLQSRRGNSPATDRSFQKNQNNPLGKINSRNASHNSFTTLKGNGESADTPTRIIVLKPNLGKPHDPQNIISSPPYTLPDYNKPTNPRDARVNGKKIPVDMGLKHNQRGAGETTKKLARRMGNIVDSGSVNFSTPSRFKGYCGDESSSSMSGNESESDSAAVTSKRFSMCNDRQKSPSTRFSESSVSREAKKRLSVRWKKTHIPQEIEVVNQGNTLGEMLFLLNKEKQPSNKDAKVRLERSSTERFKSDAAKSVRSLGINNRDSQDRCVGSPPSIVFESSRSTIHHKSLQSNMSKVPMERNKGVKGIYAQHDGLPLSKLRYTNKCQTTSHLEKEQSETSAETPCTENQPRSTSRDMNMLPQHIRCSLAPVTNFGRIPEIEHEKRTITWEPTSETFTNLLFQGNFSSELHDLPVEELLNGPHRDAQSIMHCPVTEIEESSSSKEAAQSSPVSIFNAPFQDDASSAPDCFEKLNPDPHGICLQVHLLKSELEAIDQTLVHTWSDHALEEASVALSEDDRAKTQWKTFYIADVLTNSGFEYADQETFMSNCHSSQNPIDPVVFEKLEKKYDDKNSSRSERRLLFDSINSRIQEIYRQIATRHCRMGMTAASIGAVCNKERLQIQICESLASNQKRVGEDRQMEVSTSESKWLDLANEIDFIGRELEELLFHELVVEEICM